MNGLWIGAGRDLVSDSLQFSDVAMISKKDLAKKIQHTNVRADATLNMITRHCQQAADFGFHAVMLQPCWIRLARDILSGTGVRIATAICYPMGGETLEMKLEMVRQVKKLGADEFDFQPNIGFLKSGMIKEFCNEIVAIVKEAEHLPVKLMSEFTFLDNDEKKQCILLGEEAGVSYIKNSSGVGPGGSAVTVEDIHFIKNTIKGKAKIKASGQIKSYDQAVLLLDAGADLLGTSAAAEIIQRIRGDPVIY